MALLCLGKDEQDKTTNRWVCLSECQKPAREQGPGCESGPLPNGRASDTTIAETVSNESIRTEKSVPVGLGRHNSVFCSSTLSIRSTHGSDITSQTSLYDFLS